jgi:hypothetical protein
MSDGVRDSDLFQPSLTGVDHSAPATEGRPWRLGSQFYVAFFGGPLAVGAIAVINATRLRMPDRKRLLLLGIALAGFVVAVAVALLAGDRLSGSVRLVSTAAGIATSGLLYVVQRPYDRSYHAFTNGDEDDLYDSLVGPGLLAVLTLGIAQFVALGIASES